MQAFKQPLSKDLETYYLTKCKSGNLEARNILVEYNLRLVAHIVKKYNNYDRDLEDLLSIGTIGLIKAINTYDDTKGNRLVTYASRCIENEILMMLRQEKKYAKDFSLHEPIGTDKEGNEINLLDIIESQEKDIPEQIILNENITNLHQQLYQVLDNRELQIIKLRYGLACHTPLTQREIAKKLAISRSYVSRIEKRALNKLAQSFHVFPT